MGRRERAKVRWLGRAWGSGRVGIGPERKRGQGCSRREGAETTRQREGGFRGGKAGRGGGIGERRGENCELASDVALPFLGFTSFIRRAAGFSRAVELQFLLFWKHTKSENSRYCGCKGLKCFLFRASERSGIIGGDGDAGGKS